MKIGQTVQSLQVHKNKKQREGGKKIDTDYDNFTHMRNDPP